MHLHIFGTGEWIFKYIFLISKHNPFPFFVYIMLFTISFVFVIVAVGVLTAPSKSRKLTHTDNLLLCVLLYLVGYESLVALKALVK